MMKGILIGFAFILSFASNSVFAQVCVSTGTHTYACYGSSSGGNFGAFMPPSAPSNSQSTSYSPSAYKERVCADSYGEARGRLGSCTKNANNKSLADYDACPQESEVVVSIPGVVEVKTTPNATCTKLADLQRSITIENCKIDFENRKVPDGCNSDGTVKK